MAKLTKLFQYIPYFERATGEESKNLIKERQLFGVEYEEEVYHFFNAVSSVDSKTCLCTTQFRQFV